MPVFDWVESSGSTLELQPRVIVTQFGDGYEQRADDGLNPVKQVWSLVFDGVEVSIADEIQQFLQPGLARVVFDWTPPRGSTALKWKCTSFRRALGATVGEHDLSATFEQVFEP